MNLFYLEPDPDRWFKYDRYPRKLIRRILRGKERPGGVAMVAINLMKGLDLLGVPYRLNDFKYIRNHPEEIACIIGKPHVLFNHEWRNPTIFGAGVYSHPADCPELLSKYPNVKRILVPGEWIRDMFEPYYHEKVVAWPVGIDTDDWSGSIKGVPEVDFLIYDKVRWDHEKYQKTLIDPICRTLEENAQSYEFIKYGSYKPNQLKNMLRGAKAVIFLCEHETQGLAYQQILATGTPILAWERGGYWQDPSYYPGIKYQPVSAVPYWDDRCGMKFTGTADFPKQLKTFLSQISLFNPRSYITENLTLEKCARSYLDIYHLVATETNDKP
ncbi:hypothetical protein [Mucilaginibacter sp. BT774]|uniref:hypothetical protein n=1 Tax=Mucilaginibacter sp. BT774 TaxID=3062276 RepID=UPI002676798C|nr:hypothetical protein [Mucilaginibacter sp. BT774]MDO3627490.1 hypothetical protein [Mucilaginibacter sp. BT774]